MYKPKNLWVITTCGHTKRFLFCSCFAQPGMGEKPVSSRPPLVLVGFSRCFIIVVSLVPRLCHNPAHLARAGNFGEMFDSFTTWALQSVRFYDFSQK